MPFPPAPRVVYARKPLKSVVCQLRFPPILRIDAELPVNFQDRIRRNFPNFTEMSDVTIQVPTAALGEQVPADVIRQVLQSSLAKNYVFASADGSSQVNLMRIFVAMTTSAYETWENFRERFLVPFRALMEVYNPAYFSRIGLRYLDVFVRSEVGLTDVPWRDLLSPALIGLLEPPNTADFVETFQSSSEMRLTGEGNRARVVATLRKAGNGNEDAFMLDSDFFNGDRTEVGAAFDRLDFLHSYASRLLRWAITDRLHQAMEPRAL